MNLILKRVLSVLFLSGLIIHYVFIFFYASPLSSMKSKLNGYSQLYCYPFFQQSWSLFVPTPNKKNTVLIKFRNDKKWLKIVPLKSSYNNQRNLVMHDAIHLLFSNSTYYLLNSLPKKSIIYSNKPNTIGFKNFNYILNQYLKLDFLLSKNTSYDMIVTSYSDEENLFYLFKNVKLYNE